jgi:6-phosphogluconate dehydrogenase (decarboxylating)
MQLGMIGLGRMGSAMVRRLAAGGHACVVHDAHARAIDEALQSGVVGAATREDLVARLARPRHGSVISSWLLDLTAGALANDSALANYAGRVSDSGEGRWTIAAAVDEGVPAPVLSAALYERFSSRGNAEFADRVLSAMRHAFGGHVEKPVDPR